MDKSHNKRELIHLRMATGRIPIRYYAHQVEELMLNIERGKVDPFPAVMDDLPQIDKEISLKIRGLLYYVPVENSSGYEIISLPSSDYSLSKPIRVKIEKEGGVVFAKNDELDITGVGYSVREATRDFGSFLIQDYLNLKKEPINNLSPGAKQLLEHYENTIHRIRE